MKQEKHKEPLKNHKQREGICLLRVHRMDALHEKFLAPVLQEEDLTFNQVLLLVLLHEMPGAHISQLADVLGGAQSNLSSLCKRMETRGLIRREKHNRDERRVCLFLSDEGERVTGRIYDFLGSRRWMEKMRRSRTTFRRMLGLSAEVAEPME